MAHQHMGDTVKLVVAMMRLRHNTKFKGGLDLGGAPSSVASSKEHLEFLRLFRGQILQQMGNTRGGDEIAGDGDMLTAKFAETQIRVLVNSELEACLVLHESEEFWQQRLERPGARLRNWLEMGPWTWKTHTADECGEEYFERLSRCRKLLRLKILSTGSLQLHLTQMKQAYVEGTLEEWNVAALSLIRGALEPKDAVDDTAFSREADRDPAEAKFRPASLTRENSRFRSVASAAPSVAFSPVHGINRQNGMSVGTPRRPSASGRVPGFSRMNSSSPRGRLASGLNADGIQEGFDQAAINSHTVFPSPLRVRRGREDESLWARVDLAGLLRDARQDSWGGGVEAGRKVGVMDALLATSQELIDAVQTQPEEMIPTLLGPIAPPSKPRRNWLFIAVATPAVLAATVYMYRNRRGLKGSLSLVRGSLMQFIREHISEPFWGIYNDLVHNKPLTMTDANALADTSYSLEQMLEAFIKDTKPDLSDVEVKQMAETGDMSVVSREYEKSIINAWKSFVAGDIVRMMLIQVQFIKRELLIATTAIGQLARENELNLRMMATVPAFLLAWGTYRAARPAYYLLTSEKSRESTFRAMRTIVLAMERLLNLRHREGTWLKLAEDAPTAAESAHVGDEEAVGRGRSFSRPAGNADNGTRQVLISGSNGQGLMAVRVLDELDLGKLMMLIHQLRRLIRSGPRRFQRRESVSCQEDLAELVGERELVSVGQQLAIVQRMQRSYAFLKLDP